MGSASDFDFWLGTWRARWDDDEGRKHGTNTVTKQFGGNVIHEHFDGRPGAEFQGLSVSVYSPQLDAWLQTWVDDQTNYWDLVGRFANDEMTLVCDDKPSRGALKYRMRFFDIRADAFSWTWERSEDGGASWVLRWQISYERIADRPRDGDGSSPPSPGLPSRPRKRGQSSLVGERRTSRRSASARAIKSSRLSAGSASARPKVTE